MHVNRATEKINIIVTAKMGNGTIQAKLEPLSRIEKIRTIYFLRKAKGPDIPKVQYIILPSICRVKLFHLILAPLYLIYYSYRYNVSYIFSYHIIPYAFFASVASFICRKPYFVCQTGLLIQKKAENFLFWLILKRVLLRARKLCVPGYYSRNFWEKMGIPLSKVLILHSTINTDKYQPVPSMEKTYDFIYVGRVSWEKRLDFLIKSFVSVVKTHPLAKLLIVGDGPLLTNMKNLVDSLNLNNNIYFVGYQFDVHAWLNKSKYIVLTSETEGLPCSIMEGMSAGLVPLTTNVGNLSDAVIDGVTGYLVEKDDLEGFAGKMRMLLTKDSKETKLMRVKAREKIIENHSYNYATHQWAELLGL